MRHGRWIILLAVAACADPSADSGAPSVPATSGSVPTAVSLQTPPSIANDVPGLFEMAMDEAYVYWVDNGQFDGESAVRRMPRGGGAIETLVPMGARVYTLALDDEHVYFARSSVGSGVYDGEIYRVAKSGGTAVRLATGLNPLAVAVGRGHVYYTKAYAYEGQIWRVPTGGGASELVVDAIDAPSELAFGADDGALYYTEMNRGRVMRLAAIGDAPVELAGGWVGTDALALDDAYVYFSACGSGACSGLYRVARHGGTVAHLFEAPLGTESKISVAGGMAVWGSFLVPLDGSAPTTVFEPQPAGPLAIGVVAGDHEAFLGDFFSGAIYRATW